MVVVFGSRLRMLCISKIKIHRRKKIIKMTVCSTVHKMQIAQSTYEEKGQLSASFLSTISDAPLAQMSQFGA